jgi:hypothetical protein
MNWATLFYPILHCHTHWPFWFHLIKHIEPNLLPFPQMAQRPYLNHAWKWQAKLQPAIFSSHVKADMFLGYINQLRSVSSLTFPQRSIAINYSMLICILYAEFFDTVMIYTRDKSSVAFLNQGNRVFPWPSKWSKMDRMMKQRETCVLYWLHHTAQVPSIATL